MCSVRKERNEQGVFRMILFYAPLMDMSWLLNIIFA